MDNKTLVFALALCLFLPPLPSFGKACTRDSDCVLVRLGCCGCGSGGVSTAVHKSQKAEHLKRLNRRCPFPQICSMIYRCHEVKAARCSNGVCTVQLSDEAEEARGKAAEAGRKADEVIQAELKAVAEGAGAFRPIVVPGGGSGPIVAPFIPTVAPPPQAPPFSFKPIGEPPASSAKIQSAVKKIEKQRRFLLGSAIASGLVGGYLLKTQCCPSSAGCAPAEGTDAPFEAGGHEIPP